MLSLLAISQDAAALTPGSSLDYSGFPTVISALASDELADLRVRTHSVQAEIVGNTLQVSSTTVYRNGPRERSKFYAIRIPRFRQGDEKSGQPSFAIKATLDKKPLPLRSERDRGIQTGEKNDVQYLNYLIAPVNLAPNATYALRVQYTVPLGRGGYEFKQRLVGYHFPSLPQAIEQLAFSVRFGDNAVYQLPIFSPKEWPWEIGEKGSALRVDNLIFARVEDAPQIAPPTVLAAFYPGGFDGSGSAGAGR